MTTRTELRNIICAQASSPEDAEQKINAFAASIEKAAYRRAIEAVRAEYLNDDTGTAEDEAYNQGIADAAAAIDALNEHPTT
ncbi:hypothetical protein AB0O08_15710 [Streptomyces anulatus]|uniref:hypothetical protein n=1 Tax=Streptomyces anulatus TaxID=1892 RepID=UPI00342CACEF